jgi:L-ascorbate metabolism protein UlaG (beta-lactamase superfamily)
MVNDPSPSPWHGSTDTASREPRRQSFFSKRPPQHENQVGLLPAQGWRQRNLQFLGDILIPTLLSPRQPKHAVCDLPLTARHEIGITWLGHAGFLVQMEGANILIDPNWALWHGPVKRLRHPTLSAQDMPPIDLVLITHAHFDHLHLPSLRRIANGQPIMLPRGVGSIVKRCGFGEIIELNTWQTASFQDLRITLTPARHWGARFIHDTHRQFGGFLIQSATRASFHCGDSSLFDGFSEIGQRASIDIAMMPIGAYQPPSGRPVHMNPEEALTAFQMLGAHNMVPMHHDTFPLSGEPRAEPLQRLQAAALQLGLTDRVQILDEGQSVIY